MKKDRYEVTLAKDAYLRPNAKAGDTFDVKLTEAEAERLEAMGVVSEISKLTTTKQSVKKDELSDEAKAYKDSEYTDIVARIESGELSPDDAERLEAEIGKSRKSIAEAIEAKRGA